MGSRAALLAAELDEVDTRLKREIDVWLRDGGRLNSPSALPVRADARAQQTAYRPLIDDPELATAVVARIGPELAEALRANIGAGRRLRGLVVPVEAAASLNVLAAASPKALLGFYAEGERAWGTPWTVLAAVNFVESRFGRVVGPSPAGALGPMQFMPETWRRWGDGGDVMDPHDSILAAARYLQAHEVLRDPRGALFEYNRCDDYVEAILDYAGEMQRDRCSFFAYYLWQPFVQTVAGDRAQVES